jgi:hypothetical protein
MAQVAKGKVVTPKVPTVDFARLGFGKLANSNSGSLETICTVKDACGPNGQFGFTSKNWKRAQEGKKLLAVKIVNPDLDEPVAYIPCSVAVTEMILSGEIKMKHLASLPINETEEGRLKVTLPEGSSVDQMVDANAVKAETLEFAEGDFLPTDLLGL